jgi:hypothetical protein
MLFKNRNFDEVVKNMKSLAVMLMPHNYPQNPMALFEEDLEIFKEREVVIDGYSVILYYQISNYEIYHLKSLQVHNKIGPFLPFNVVVKIAKKFLGTEQLSLIEVFKSNKKIYCWSVATDEKDNPVETPYISDAQPCEFEGLKYLYITPAEVFFH